MAFANVKLGLRLRSCRGGQALWIIGYVLQRVLNWYPVFIWSSHFRLLVSLQPCPEISWWRLLDFYDRVRESELRCLRTRRERRWHHRSYCKQPLAKRLWVIGSRWVTLPKLSLWAWSKGFAFWDFDAWKTFVSVQNHWDILSCYFDTSQLIIWQLSTGCEDIRCLRWAAKCGALSIDRISLEARSSGMNDRLEADFKWFQESLLFGCRVPIR